MLRTLTTIAAVLAIAGTAAAQTPARPTPLQPGAKAPDFTLKTWDGTRTVKLSDYRAVPATATTPAKPGKVVVVDFWCSKCPGSRRFETKLAQLTRDYQSKDVVVLAIDPNGLATTAELKAYITQNDLLLSRPSRHGCRKE